VTMSNDAFSPDELISTYLDGDATAEQIQRVENDPQLARKATETKAAIEAVGAPIDFSAVDLDALRAIAVAEAPSSSVIDMAAARARRSKRLNQVALVAAAFVLLAFGATIVANNANDVSEVSGELTASSNTSADDAGTSDDSAADSATMADDDMAAEMADGATMADEEMAPEMAADSAMAESAPSDGAGKVASALLPPELAAVPDAAALQVMLTDITSSIDPLMLDPQSIDAEQLLGLCPALRDAVTLIQPDGSRLVDTATATIGGQPATVVIAIGFDDTAVAFVGYGPACDPVQALDAGLP